MWIFGQVWFACLVGFAVGVVLDWVVRVRPLSNRLADLEQRLASDARSARHDGDVGRSVFDRGPFAPANMDADGFAAQRNRGGLLTPERGARPGDGGMSTQLIGMEPGAPTEVRSGVDDYPGVSRLSNWEAEAEEATRNAPEPWHPPTARTATPPAANPEETEPEWQPILPPPTERPGEDAWRSELSPPIEPPPPTDAHADQQYLDFLRAGTPHAPAEQAATDDGNQYDADQYEDEYQTGEFERGDYDGTSGEMHGDMQGGMQGEVPDEDPAEVTSVLPFPISEQTDANGPRIEGYEAYESYAGEYQGNGQRNGYQEGYEENYQGDAYEVDYQFGQYQPEEVEEPEGPGTPLPRRGSASPLNFTPFAPFEIPFEAGDDAGDDAGAVGPRSGELTPISDGGWQPFQKPAEVGDDVDYQSDYETVPWTPGDAELAGAAGDGAHALHGGADDPGSTWFDQTGRPEMAPAEMTLTQRMLPVSRPDLDHPDLLGTSVFGGESDAGYADDGTSRSLFEPVVPADVLEDEFAAPAYADQNHTDGGHIDSGPATDEFLAAKPVRVRTGVDGPATQSIPAMQPVPMPYQGPGGPAGDVAAGPFGPGSALPQPDGSAPAPEFTIKARTSSMVFHTESSPFYQRLEPQVWFRSQEDAQRAGFTSWERPRTW